MQTDVRKQMVRQLGDGEDVDEVEEEFEARRSLIALSLSADDRQLRDDRARSGRHAASIGRADDTRFCVSLPVVAHSSSDRVA
jgi:hypothetical protein